MLIGERIKQSRKQLEMTQQELATGLNVSRSAISNWEIGRNYPDLDSIVLLSDILDVSLDELLREDVKMVKKVSQEQRKNHIRKYLIRILIPVLSLAMILIGWLSYTEIKVVNDWFTPVFTGAVEIKTSQENQWVAINWSHNTMTDTTQELTVRGLFLKKELVELVEREESSQIRITDLENNKVISEFTVKDSGSSQVIPKIQKKKSYLVEVKGSKGQYMINIY